MARENHGGAGVLFMVNEGGGRRRKAENVTKVRALFVDLDGAPLDPILAWELKPNLVVERSPGRYHAYWICHDTPPREFRLVQQALAFRFGGDKQV